MLSQTDGISIGAWSRQPAISGGVRSSLFSSIYYYFCSKVSVPGTGKAIFLGMKRLLFQMGEFRIPPRELIYQTYIKNQSIACFSGLGFFQLCPHLGHSRSKRHIET